MQYMVTGADGKEYGPTDIATLRAWAAENRLAPHTQLRDFSTGQVLAASAVPGLFPGNSNVPPTTSAYPRAGASMGYAPTGPVADAYGGAFAGVVLRSVLGVVLFFVLHGIGLIVAGTGLITAFQIQSRGSKWGVPALAISILSVVAIGIGWALRLSMGR